MPAASSPIGQADHSLKRESSVTAGQYFLRAATIAAPSKIDRNGRTIEATISTESPVSVFDRPTGRVIQEVLVASGAELMSWAPLLREHDLGALEHVIGSVLSPRRVGREIRATLRFASVDDVNPIWLRVRDGHLRAVSVGGRRVEWTDIEAGKVQTIAGRRWIAGNTVLRVTTRWILREASIVIFGGDEHAMMRPV